MKRIIGIAVLAIAVCGLAGGAAADAASHNYSKQLAQQITKKAQPEYQDGSTVSGFGPVKVVVAC
jgi:hypothetical protein